MITSPEHLTDFVIWFFLTSFFAAFTTNVQRTTLQLGKMLSNTHSEIGIQDAITPKWQTRNNIINIVLLTIYLAVCLYVFKWYLGLAIYIATFFIIIQLISRFLMIPPSSKFIVRKIYKDLLERQHLYEQEGDKPELAAITSLIKGLNEITSID